MSLAKSSCLRALMMIIKILKKDDDNNNNNKSNSYKSSAGLKAQSPTITHSILPSCDCDLFVTILLDPDASASLSVLEHSLKTKEDCLYADLCICPICDISLERFTDKI